MFFLLLILFSSCLLAQQDTLLADSLYYDGKDFYRKGKYLEARASLNRALAQYEKIYGQKHERVMKANYHLGRAHWLLVLGRINRGI